MKKSISPDCLYFENLGTDFDKFISDYDVSCRIKLIFDRLLPCCAVSPQSSALEIGCGTGRISSHIHKQPWSLTVNDISTPLCQQVAESLHCQAMPGDCTRLPCADTSFDIIISSECIEHTADPQAAIKEMIRVLKPNGWLIITTPNKLWHPVLPLAELLKIRKFHGIENWTWPLAMGKWLKQNSCQNVCFNGCHLFPWQIPLAKKVLPFFDKHGNILYPVMINYGFCAKKCGNTP
jgi:ubiquinone/menaquinone biosynthesis C-methylase UbiE